MDTSSSEQRRSDVNTSSNTEPTQNENTPSNTAFNSVLSGLMSFAHQCLNYFCINFIVFTQFSDGRFWSICYAYNYEPLKFQPSSSVIAWFCLQQIRIISQFSFTWFYFRICIFQHFPLIFNIGSRFHYFWILYIGHFRIIRSFRT